jgi:HlyD family secretion protein
LDVARPPRSRAPRNIGIAIGLVALAGVTLALSRLKPAAPTVDASSLVTDTVRRGDLVREVRGPGSLVPERLRFITAQTSARVERILSQSGQTVTPSVVLLELTNPDLQLQTMQAEQQVRQAQIDLLNLKTNLNSQRLTQEGLVATTRTQYVSATQEAAAAESLLARNLISRFEANNKKAQAEELTTRLRVERQRLQLMSDAIESQIAVQAAQVEQLRAIAANQQNRLRSLQVRSPDAGVVQELNLQPGQWVPEGTMLAKVIQPGRLKAVLRIPESQAKDVLVGQRASIDTRNGIIRGTVARKDPSAQAGTVTVDVALEGTLPAGAVPDLSVDGVIEIEHLRDVLSTGRPTGGGGTGDVRLFVVAPGGHEATRATVVLGRTSVTAVEVVRGLKVGDRVILSDMAQFDAVDRVRIK